MKRLTNARNRCVFCKAADEECAFAAGEFSAPCPDYKTYQRLSAIEGILGDEYDLDRLRELIEADKDGRTIVLPAQIGESLWHITTCKGFSKVLDGTMYGANGEIGTATGCYCPCELAENCPFLLEEDESFDCEKYKNIMAIYEDVVTDIVINDMESYMRLDYSGCVDFDDVGKTVFLTREEAEAAMEKMEGGNK